MRTTFLAVAVMLMVTACGGPEVEESVEPAAAAPEVACEQRWLLDVPRDDGRLCSYGTITVRFCPSTWPPESPPDACASWR